MLEEKCIDGSGVSHEFFYVGRRGNVLNKEGDNFIVGWLNELNGDYI